MVKLEEVVDEDLQKSQEGPLGGEDDWEDSEDGIYILPPSDGDDDDRDGRLVELDDGVKQWCRDLNVLAIA